MFLHQDLFRIAREYDLPLEGPSVILDVYDLSRHSRTSWCEKSKANMALNYGVVKSSMIGVIKKLTEKGFLVSNDRGKLRCTIKAVDIIFELRPKLAEIEDFDLSFFDDLAEKEEKDTSVSPESPTGEKYDTGQDPDPLPLISGQDPDPHLREYSNPFRFTVDISLIVNYNPNISGEIKKLSQRRAFFKEAVDSAFYFIHVLRRSLIPDSRWAGGVEVEKKKVINLLAKGDITYQEFIGAVYWKWRQYLKSGGDFHKYFRTKYFIHTSTIQGYIGQAYEDGVIIKNENGIAEAVIPEVMINRFSRDSGNIFGPNDVTMADILKWMCNQIQQKPDILLLLGKMLRKNESMYDLEFACEVNSRITIQDWLLKAKNSLRNAESFADFVDRHLKAIEASA